MQGLESLNQFQNFVSTLGGLGRFEDTYMIHAAEGETIVPMEVLDRNPLLKKRLFESMRDMGIEPERYIVGNEFNSLNPLTGQPEFFLKKILQRVKKGIADVSGYAAPVIGAMYGPAAGAAAGAAMGSFKRENPGDPSQWAQMGLRGGASGLAANLASGQGLTPFGGMAEKYGYKPSEIWGGLGDILTKGTKSDFLKGYTNPFTQDDSFLKKAWESISGGGKIKFTEALEQIEKLHPEWSDDKQIAAAEELAKGGGGNKLLMGLLGIGGTLGLGKLIGEPEDITVDRSKLMTTPIDTGQVFSPTQPTTVYKDYDIPIAAEGGIIGYNSGGWSGSPHGYGEMEGPYWREDESRPDYTSGEIEMWRNFIQEKQKESYDEEKMEHLKELMKDPEFKQRLMEKMFGAQTMEARHGGIMDLQGGGFSQGPGTGTSDSIPAMLSDGEFVMTADAVRGAGGGNRREGARRMYEMMDGLEARA